MSELQKAQLENEIERLAIDIDYLENTLIDERNAKADGIRMYTTWLEGMIEMEATHPMGPDNTHILKGCLEYFNKMVAK